MIEIHIPGYKKLDIKYLTIDFNGTIAEDGELIAGVPTLINALSEDLKIYILSADTYGNVREMTKNLECEVKVISEQNQAYTKQQFVRQLGSQNVVAIGNGRNDQLMLEESALGIAVIQKEGGAVGAINSADLVMNNIIDALGCLVYPIRLVASLRA